MFFITSQLFPIFQLIVHYHYWPDPQWKDVSYIYIYILYKMAYPEFSTWCGWCESYVCGFSGVRAPFNSLQLQRWAFFFSSLSLQCTSPTTKRGFCSLNYSATHILVSPTRLLLERQRTSAKSKPKSSRNTRQSFNWGHWQSEDGNKNGRKVLIQLIFKIFLFRKCKLKCDCRVTIAHQKKKTALSVSMFWSHCYQSRKYAI